jgi:hypothetical protein
MYTPAVLISLALSLSTTLAMPFEECHNTAVDDSRGGRHGHPKAIYFMTNTEQNKIVALKVANDGTLSDGSVTPTGGAGATEVEPMTGKPMLTDPLASQGSVRVAGKVSHPPIST